MASAKEYQHQVAILTREIPKIEASTAAEGKAALASVRSLQTQLRQIKRNINLDMKAIRAQYTQRMSQAGSGMAAAASIFGKRRAAGSIRADAKRRVSTERDRVLAPYNNVKLMIDDLLVRLDGAKIRLTEWIEQAKLEEQASKPAEASPTLPDTMFCPACGQKVNRGDTFCRKCGGRL